MSPSIRKSHARVSLDELIHRTGRSLDRHRDAFWRLVNAIRASSELLSKAEGPSRDHWLDKERIVAACSLIATRCEQWTREPESWTPSAAGQWQQLRSLLDHLFARFPVPAFMTSAWLYGQGQDWEANLYLHLAQGLSVRQFQSPFSWRLSKAGARWFMQAPDDHFPLTAFRWAQVRSLGGDNGLARSLLWTLLIAPTIDEAFWERVIRFLIENSPLAGDEVESIVRFIYRQRFAPAESVWGRGAGVEPLQPAFSLEGWTLSTLRRHMANWQTELACRMPVPIHVNQGATWEPTTIEPFQLEDGSEVWSVRELLTAGELQAEGGIMRHCVGSYVSACRHRRTSIWSMRVEQGEVQKRVLTIEVLPATMTIRQAQGRRNAPPTPAARRLLLLWAKRSGLRFADSVT